MEDATLLRQTKPLNGRHCGAEPGNLLLVTVARNSGSAAGGRTIGASAGQSLRGRYRMPPDDFADLPIPKTAGRQPTVIRENL